MDTFFWNWSGDRQANRLRTLYLASVLSQEIAFFDTVPNGTGGLLQGLNQDSGDIEAAIGDKLGQLIKSVSTFIAGACVCVCVCERAFVEGDRGGRLDIQSRQHLHLWPLWETGRVGG